MKKRLFTFILALLPMVVSAYDFMVDGIAYKLVSLSDLTCEITTGSTVEGTTLTVKASVEYKGKPFSVIGVGGNAFSGKDISELNLESGITYIGESAFSGNNLSKIVIPNTVKDIYQGAFATNRRIYQDSKFIYLPVELIINDGTEQLTGHDNTFSWEKPFGDTGIKKAYIGRNINAQLLSGISGGIEILIIGNQVTDFDVLNINEYTFQGFYSLKTLVIGTGLQVVPSFNEGNQVESIYVTATTPQAAVGFNDNTYLHTTLYVPTGTKELYENAEVWKNFWTIEEGSIEDRQEEDYAEFDSANTYDFMVDGIAYKLVSLSDLTCEVTTGSKVEGTTLTVKPSVEYKGKTFSVIGVGGNAFSGKNISELNLESGITYIGESAFSGNNLSKIVIPNTVKDIYQGAFATNRRIYQDSKFIYLPVELIINDGTEQLTGHDNTLSWEKPFGDTGIKKAYIGRNINGQLLNGVSEGIEDLTIGDNVTTFDVLNVNWYTVQGFHSLKTLVIGKGLQKVPSFNEGEQLESIYVKAETPQAALGFNDNTYLHTTLYVPTGTKELYENAEVWKNFWTIEEGSIEDRQEEGYAEFDSTTGTLTFKYGVKPDGDNIYETDFTSSWSSADIPWVSIREEITSVVFDPSFSFARPRYTAFWFYYAKNLKTISGIYYLNASKVSSMEYMFYNCQGLTSLDLSNLNTSNINYFDCMYYNCINLKNLNLNGFDTRNARSMYGMFAFCTSLSSLNVSSFDTKNVYNMEGMFYSCKSLSSLNVSNFDTRNVKYMDYMFHGCEQLTSLDLSNFNTSLVQTMEYMFQLCINLRTLNISNFDTGRVTEMNGMFSHCNMLQSLDLSKFNTSNVTSMECMFQLCYTLKNLDLSNFNTSNVTNMNRMFYLCNGLTSINVSKFNTKQVKDMGYMFAECGNLTNLDLSSFNTSNVTVMDSLFCRKGLLLMKNSYLNKWGDISHTYQKQVNNTSNLKTIFASKAWNTEAVTKGRNPFAGCIKLVGGNGTTYNEDNDGIDFARIDATDGLPGYFTKGSIMGDVNGDGELTIEDVRTVEDYIMKRNPWPFIFSAADMNHDDKINAADIVEIINMVK